MQSSRVSLVCAAALFVCMVQAHAVFAQKEFFIEDQTLLTGSADQEIVLEANSDITFLGFSFGVLYDPNVLEVTQVTWEGALAAEPDFYNGMIGDGKIGYGCVFDFGPEFPNSIPPGSNIALSRIIVTVLAEEDVDTTLTIADAPFNPDRPVKNVITNEEGFSEVPALTSGNVHIRTLAPEIVSISGNSGFAGTMFTVTGNNFDQSGLAVTVCSANADFSLDGDTLTVTAPACGDLGFAELVVSTDRGTDTEPNGFEYLEVPPDDVVVSGVNPPSGPVGTEITISGLNFEGDPAAAVTICGIPVPDAVVVDNETITAVVPACDGEGQVEVTVCRGEDNCASGTFNIGDVVAGTPFRRGDPANTGGVNISGPIFILNFLFGGGDGPSCREAADINNDGQVNVTDPVNLLNHLFGDGAPPAPPGLAACGLDPDEPGSARDLGCDEYTRC